MIIEADRSEPPQEGDHWGIFPGPHLVRWPRWDSSYNIKKLKSIIIYSNRTVTLIQQSERCSDNLYLHKNSQTVKKGAAHAKKGSMKKFVKSKVAAQKWLSWSDNGKIFSNNNSGKFVTEFWKINLLGAFDT